MTDLKTVQDLYDRNLYVQAFRESEAYWTPGTEVGKLPTAALVLGGRLAARLGGQRLSRWLLMAAHERAPQDPAVRYFSMRVRRRGNHLFDVLREFERDPEQDTEDPGLLASWFASQAVIWASVHDFSRAEALLARAEAIGAEGAWVSACRSDVLGLADRWEEALPAAESAWERNPGAPYAARSLGTALMQLGRVEESSARLALAAEAGESFEVVETACWHLCALAETLKDEKRREPLERAHALVERLPALALLMDRETQSLVARIRFDLAELMDERETARRWIGEIRSPFFRQVSENLQRNPQGSRVRLPFRRVTQRRDTCLPTSLAAILPTAGLTVDPEEFAREVTYAGTPFWAAAEWLEQRGIDVTFFTVTSRAAKDLLRAGFPFVMGFLNESSAHAVAAFGFDEAAGTLLIHDPNSFRSVSCLIDFIGESEQPIGPQGMAVSAPGATDRLKGLLDPANVAAATSLHRHQREMERGRPSAARTVLAGLASEYPDHVATRYLVALQTLEDGRAGEAIEQFQALVREYPGCVRFRNGLLWACDGMGNTALMRDTLEKVVERAALPGIQSSQEWRYPPVPYVTQYADQLRRSAVTRPKARRLLKGALGRDWTSSETWHVFADLLWEEQDTEGMLLAFRLASCLEPTNEHFAMSYCDALRDAGREQEGLDWLHARTRRFETSRRAVGPWISWISTLENHGYPEEALQACREALQRHEGSSELLAFAVPFLARMGLWEEADQGLRQLEQAGNRSHHFEAAVLVHRMRGDLDGAVGLAEAWVEASPRSMSARQSVLELCAARQGERAAAVLSGRWSAEHPGHDYLEEMHYQQLRNLGDREAQDALLVGRARRNTHDGWAWRELAFLRLSDYEAADESGRERLKPLVVKLLNQCHRMAPGDPSTLRTQAEWHAVRGRWRRAVAVWLSAIDREPGNFYSYRRVWEASAGFTSAERLAVFSRLETALLRGPGRLSLARELIPLAAIRFGVRFAEDAALRWMKARSDDPEVIESFADLLLQYGHGRTDAVRALAVLEPAVKRFPYHIGLRFSLAHAHRVLGNHGAAEATCGEIVRRHPASTRGRCELAWVHERQGKLDQARAELEAASRMAPFDPDLRIMQARFLMRHDRHEEALDRIGEGLERMPEAVAFREMAIDVQFECGDEEGAVRTARAGIEVHPEGAYPWFLLADALNRARRFAAPGEVESCLRAALAHNGSLYPAADALAVFLVEQRRHDEAEALLKGFLPRLADPTWPRARLAWILRERGRRDEAFEAMKGVVTAMPWFRWGWDRLFDWLTEDERWEEARALLGSTPPEMLSNTRFRRRRLLALAAAGLPAQSLDREWDELLGDFPEDLDLHLERHDELREQNRSEEAVRVLEGVRSMVPDDPFVGARVVQGLAEAGNGREVLEETLKIWFADVEESSWPARTAWEACRRAEVEQSAYDAALARLGEGLRPTSEALSILGEHAMQGVSGGQGEPKNFWKGWFPAPGVRELLRVLDMLDRCAWVDGRSRAILVHYLCKRGYYRQVVRYWSHELHGDAGDGVELWSWIGMALAAIRPRRAREFLGTWRERVGVGMWVIANYVLCFSVWKRGDRLAVVESCRDALGLLPHDHAAKGLAHILAEMCILECDLPELEETWKHFRSYFSGALEEEEWMEPQHRYLLEAVPTLGGLIDSGDWDGLLRRCRRLKRQRLSASVLDSCRLAPRAAWWVPLGLVSAGTLARLLVDLLRR